MTTSHRLPLRYPCLRPGGRFWESAVRARLTEVTVSWPSRLPPTLRSGRDHLAPAVARAGQMVDYGTLSSAYRLARTRASAGSEARVPRAQPASCMPHARLAAGDRLILGEV